MKMTIEHQCNTCLYSCLIIIAMSQQTLPCTPPPRTADGGLIFFVMVSSVPKKLSSKESLCFSELLRLKDPKTWFSSIFTQTEF